MVRNSRGYVYFYVPPWMKEPATRFCVANYLVFTTSHGRSGYICTVAVLNLFQLIESSRIVAIMNVIAAAI